LRAATYYPELYGPHVPRAIIDFFQIRLALRIDRMRFRIYYGNPLTGRAWGDYDEGYISLSDGDQTVPIMLYNSKSESGPAILMNNIVKIEETVRNRVLYRHPRYHTHDEEPPEVKEDATENRAPRRISLKRNEQRTT